jgi:PAS domain S-box-containing protein
MRLLQPARSPLLRYGCAVVSVVLMTALRMAVPFGQGQRYVAFYFAVIFTAWYGGLGPSILAIILSCISVSVFLLGPLHSFGFFRPIDVLGMWLFVAVSAAIVAFSQAGRAVQRRLERELRERRRAEQAERAERERHQTTLASVGDGVIVTDAEGQVVSLNRVAEDLTGWTDAQAVGRPLKQVFRTRDEVTHETAEMPLVQVVRGGIERQMDQTELAAPGGLPRPIEHCTAPIRDEHGTVIGVVIIFRDITARRRLENELTQRAEELARLQRRTAETLALLDTVFESTPVGLAYLDRKLRFRRVNPAFSSGHRVTAKEFLGHTLREVLPGWADLIESQLYRVLATGEPVLNHEVALALGATPGRGHALASYYPVCARHQVIGVGVAAVDITERKRLESELERRVAELAEADRRKDEFLATLAHELRNPLAPIRNALHLMRGHQGSTHAIEPERAMAERQVVHLARLIDDLMDIARISRGKIELRKETLLLAPLVERAVESVRPALDERHHRLDVLLPETPIWLAADPTRLEQILGNLLNNAIKYTEPGGTIGVAVASEGDDVVIRVRDSGIGIEPELLPRVFEIFVQAEDHQDRSQGGLGIGLSLVRRLVEMHGGTINAHSAGPRMGSEFVVRLPTLPAPVPAPAPDDGQVVSPLETGPAASQKPRRRRILVVDDNLDAANSLARLLKRLFGQDVRVAHDGPAALESAAVFRPEIVLLDIGMPGMDGYEVAERLRREPALPALRIIALTGWGQQTDRLRSQAVGFDHHLVKPVDPDVLCRLLE